jgi:hypothetical protein
MIFFFFAKKKKNPIIITIFLKTFFDLALRVI